MALVRRSTDLFTRDMEVETDRIRTVENEPKVHVSVKVERTFCLESWDSVLNLVSACLKSETEQIECELGCLENSKALLVYNELHEQA